MDFRIDQPHWIDVDADRRRATRLLDLASSRSASDLIAIVFGERAGWTQVDRDRRTAQVVEGVDRLSGELTGWLRAATSSSQPFLDLGCGAGQLLAAAARAGRHGVGIDVSLEWLVVARQMVIEAGGTPRLAAALAEALPLDDGAVGGVTSLDVIEHVGDQRQYLAEIARVVAPGGVIALATPNRFSLAAEPHVGVWGVGWLPRRWQASYATWRSGKPYNYCRLLGAAELRRLLRGAGLDADVRAARVPDVEVCHFRTARRLAATLYNRILVSRTGQALIKPICPFFHVTAVRQGLAESVARHAAAEQR